ncbi:uncharacterized protein BO97DRAFT_426721 [Aspergillus homomorphus CBS 101889]|uniref:Uncharacterized protein n=1 Tax=Aspergillus homomorphus (strain CBS 101889) TaxID=1450537 RepID=A0A395HVE7_ASPHC|nr:hypothetical protein BO97DRAFT_426721 [Aspergillus homomorphus CBS 101889]RAL10194.1 hypothetical protein BO97DRAFT_426721 [Aspergillus homomorphus CBS 101889]
MADRSGRCWIAARPPYMQTDSQHPQYLKQPHKLTDSIMKNWSPINQPLSRNISQGQFASKLKALDNYFNPPPSITMAKFGFSVFMLLGLLLLATDVLATRVKYNAYYNQVVHKDGKEVTEKKTNSDMRTIPDDKETEVKDGIHGWSGGKYRARESRFNMLYIETTSTLASNKEAKDAVEDMRSLVNKHIK